MGIIALSIIMISASGANELASEWIFTFEYAHIVTFFTTCFFVVHALFTMYHSYGYHRSTVHMAWSAEKDLLETIKNHNFFQKLWYEWAPFFNTTRETVEYKCIELLFCDSYWLPSQFNVPTYVSGCFERYALKTVNVGLFNWSVLAVLISLNHMRIKFHLGFNCVDPEAYSDNLIGATTDSDIGKSANAHAGFTNVTSEFYSLQPPVHRMLGGEGTVFVEKVCYDRMTYFVFICSIGLVIFTLLLFGVARMLEKRLLRRLGIRSSDDYEKFLTTMLLVRTQREKSEKVLGFDNDGRATMEQLLNEIEDCADEHEQEEEEERIYKDFLFQWKQGFTKVHELFEKVNKPFQRWFNEVLLRNSNNSQAKVGDASRILETGRVIAKSSKESLQEAQKESRVSAKFNRVAELKKKLEHHHEEGGVNRTARERLSFIIAEGGFNNSDVLSPTMLNGTTPEQADSAMKSLEKAEDTRAANCDTDSDKDEKDQGRGRVSSVEISPAQKTSTESGQTSKEEDPSPDQRSSSKSPNGWHSTRNAKKSEAAQLAKLDPSFNQHISLISESMERRKSITAARRKSMFSLSSTKEASSASQKGNAHLGRALSSQLLAGNTDSVNAHANSTLSRFRDLMDQQYQDIEADIIDTNVSIAHSVVRRVSRLTSKVGIDVTAKLGTGASADAEKAGDMETGQPPLALDEAMKKEELRRKLRDYNHELYASDMEEIYIFQNPEYYHRAVEACIMMHCFYLGVWSTNFITIVSESTLKPSFWHTMIIIPLCLLSIPALASINKISNKLDAVAHMNLMVMLETVKLNIEATEQSNNLRENILSRVSLENIGFSSDEEKLLLVDSLFGAVDIDSSGTIDQFEFRVLLKQLDLSFSDARFRVLFSAIDIEAQGSIKKYEFYNLLFPSTRQQLKELKRYYEYEGLQGRRF